MNSPLDAPPGVPALEWVLTIRALIDAPQNMGASLHGERANYPIIGGEFIGLEVRGEVLPGGADFFAQRPDGVGDLDASYSLRTDRGELINIRNRGLLTLSEHGRQLDAQGIWPLPASDYHCTCAPRFQVPNGRLAWLNRSTFIGTVHYPVADQVVIHCYRITP